MNLSASDAVAAVVVTYRSAAWIERCLDTLLIQPEVTSVWVVDNASDDHTVDLVRSRYPHVQVISNRCNIGFAAANNQALEKISEPYVLLLNPDAFLEPESVGAMLEVFRADEHMAVVGPRIIRNGMIEASLSMAPTASASWLFLLSGMRNYSTGGFSGKPVAGFPWEDGAQGEHLRGSCMLVKKTAIEDAGPLDERFFLYFEETEWCLRMRRSGWNIAITPKAIAHHEGRASVKTQSSLPSLEFMRSAILFWRIHYSPLIATGLRATLWLMSAIKYILLTCSGSAADRRGWLKKVMGLALTPYRLPIEYDAARRPGLWD